MTFTEGEFYFICFSRVFIAEMRYYNFSNATNPFFRSTIDKLMNESEVDPIAYLASCAVDRLQAFDALSKLASQFGSTTHFSNVISTKIRLNVLEILECCSRSIEYNTEIVGTALSALTGQSYWNMLNANQLPRSHNPSVVFLNDEVLTSGLLEEARYRYPYETLPFLKLVRALAPSTCLFGQDDVKTIVDYLENIPTFTHVLAPEFSAYTTYSEEDNTNSIQLTEPIHLFGPRVKLITGTKSSALLEQEPDFCIPERTTGRMVSEPNQPKVAMWYHSYSGFKYLAKLLETFLAAADQIDATTGESADPEAVTEIITTFALILNGLSKSPDAVKSRQEASRILQLASLGLNRNRDIISVVFDIFEEELQRQSVNVGSEEPLELLTSCLQFIHALIWISPGRVWPFIGRSGLLDLGRGSSKLSTIVGGIELVTGRYDFLLSCTVLFGALVEDLALNTVSRRCKSKSSKRFDGSDDMAGTGVPDQVLSKVLLSFTRFLVDAFESSCTWKFFDQDDCRQLRKNIAGTFVKILHYAYGIEESIAETVDSASEQTTPKPLVSKLGFSNSSIPKKKT